MPGVARGISSSQYSPPSPPPSPPPPPSHLKLMTNRISSLQILNPIPPRLFSYLFPLGGGRHVSHPVELRTEIFLHQNFSLSGLRVSIADFGFEGPGFDSQ